MSFERILVVSNRLPIVLDRAGEEWTVRPGSGGLVQALEPVLKRRGGLWIGWPGVVAEEGEGWRELALETGREMGYEIAPVALREEELDGFYRGFANSVLWPLFHDFLDACDFDPAFWEAYCRVNEKYAVAVAERSRPGDFVWVHDYQLIHVGHFARQRGVEHRLGFFLHIPFPPLDVFLRLPWRSEVLHAFLAYDLVGLQTARDCRNFLTCLENLLPGVEIVERGSATEVTIDGRTITVGHFPIGIPFEDFDRDARGPEVASEVARLRQEFRDRRVILGVDRLDYTKGKLQRFRAFERLLEDFQEMTEDPERPDDHRIRREVVIVQITVPSREAVPEYEHLREEVERLVGRINGRFSTPGWTPLQYHYRSIPRTTLVALYRLADVAFITSLKDGMNLVAKEYCACQVEGEGALILSDFAGAAAQLASGALMVNPYDVEGMTEALEQALLDLGPEERRRRMAEMRESVRGQDVFWWVERFLAAAEGRELPDFPGSGEYLPALRRR